MRNKRIAIGGVALLFCATSLYAAESTFETLSKQVKDLKDQVEAGNTKRAKKILRPAAEIDQLYDMECYKPYIVSFFPWQRVTDRCVNTEPVLIKEKLEILESRLLPDIALGQKKVSDVDRIAALRKKLNHDNWDSDRYWFGINESWLSKANTLSTSITIHAYPWYARSIGIFSVEDIARRTSFYLGAGQVNSSTVGINSYGGNAISAGLGVEVTKGFMLTWGASFYPETTSGVTTHIKDNVWGITLSSEIASQLMGGE